MKEDKMANLRFEYQMAQDMLRHYDNLNWLIGTILIGGILAMTGLLIGSGIGNIIVNNKYIGGVICLPVSLFSFIIMRMWLKWFD